MNKPALFWEKAGGAIGGEVRCLLCPHECLIPRGALGLCGVRKNTEDRLIAESYGKVTSIALDPIEKKPLRMFEPGGMILSAGSYGCNLRCMFCQNHNISMPKSWSKPRPKPGSKSEIAARLLSPDELLALARQYIPKGNIGAAYTYNEPLIGYEFVCDCAKLLKSAGLKNVLVTNGFIRGEPLDALLPYIDAMNIDLKGFSEDFYRNVNGSLGPVKSAIARASKSCHVEVTTLIIPGENDSDVEAIASWLSEIDPSIPLHLSRFFPRNEYAARQPTPRELVLELAETARKYLKYVFTGNM